jgi:hypothetical protein
LASEFIGWEDVLERLSGRLADSIRREIYLPYIERIGLFSSPSAKACYLFLVFFQPQNAMSLHRVLHMHENTVRGALEEIEKAGLARRDNEYLWWLVDPREKKHLTE